MQRCALVPLFALALSGCNRAGPYLEIAREQHANWDEMSKVLESITDAKSMEAARERFEELTERGRLLTRRSQALPPPTPEVLEQLKEHAAGFQESIQRVQKELARVQQLPGGADFLKEVAASAR